MDNGEEKREIMADEVTENVNEKEEGASTPEGPTLNGSGEKEQEKAMEGNLLDALKEKEREAAENYDRWLRAVAELENYKKRVAKEKADLIQYANEQIIRELLPIVDSLEKVVEHSDNKQSLKALVEGVEMTMRSLIMVLEKFGVKKINALNEPFDPKYHEAMMEIEGQGEGEMRVVKELEKGYLLNNRLIRPARVAVTRTSLPQGSERIQ